MRGGHLAILRSGFRATKESEVAAGDIVPVPSAQFEETLASASPDVLREMIREFAQRMMDADVEVRVDLLDGLALSGLMVRYNIGVQDQQTYVIKRVDEDFFDEN